MTEQLHFHFLVNVNILIWIFIDYILTCSLLIKFSPRGYKIFTWISAVCFSSFKVPPAWEGEGTQSTCCQNFKLAPSKWTVTFLAFFLCRSTKVQRYYYIGDFKILFLSETLGYRSIEKGGAQTSLRVVRGRAESQGRETNLHYRGLLSPLGSDLQSAYL